jgi:hypothetical protein
MQDLPDFIGFCRLPLREIAAVQTECFAAGALAPLFPLC